MYKHFCFLGTLLMLSSTPAHSQLLSGDAQMAAADREQQYKSIMLLAQDKRCEETSQCRVQAVGIKACGGPRTYITYSSLTTSEEELRAQVRVFDALDQRLRRNDEMYSDCMRVARPQVVCAEGRCQPVTVRADAAGLEAQ